MAAAQYYQFDGGKGWSVTYTVLIGLVLVGVAFFTLAALAKARFGRDPARRFVPWLKASFCLFFLTLLLSFAATVMATCVAYGTNIGRDTARAALHLGYLAELFRTLSAAAVMVFLLELGPGMHHAIEGVGSTFDRAIRGFAYAVAFVVAALSITYYGLLIDVQVNFSDRTGSFDRFGRGPARIRRVNELMAATAIILFFTSLVISALSVYTWMRRKASPLKQASTLYLVAGLLNLVSSTWGFAYAINWLLMNERLEPYVFVLTIILAWWSRGLLLILAFIIAVRSGPRGGVWSHSAPPKNGSLMGDSTARNSHATDGTRDLRV